MSHGCCETGDASGFRGCGRQFGGLREFDRHWTKVTIPDDPRRVRAIYSIDGSRCATDTELRDRGTVKDYRDVWRDAARLADVARRFRLPGSTEAAI